MRAGKRRPAPRYPPRCRCFVVLAAASAFELRCRGSAPVHARQRSRRAGHVQMRGATVAASAPTKRSRQRCACSGAHGQTWRRRTPREDIPDVRCRDLLFDAHHPPAPARKAPARDAQHGYAASNVRHAPARRECFPDTAPSRVNPNALPDKISYCAVRTPAPRCLRVEHTQRTAPAMFTPMPIARQRLSPAAMFDAR